jgi:hypothetical protein
MISRWPKGVRAGARFPPMDYRDELPLRLHQPFLD